MHNMTLNVRVPICVTTTERSMLHLTDRTLIVHLFREPPFDVLERRAELIRARGGHLPRCYSLAEKRRLHGAAGLHGDIECLRRAEHETQEGYRGPHGCTVASAVRRE